MTRINLLPWRESRRAGKQRNFVIMLAVALVVAAAGVYGIYLYVEQLIANQEARNTYLRGEIARLKKAEEEIKELDKVKARLLNRLQVIQDLQARRPGMVRAFDSLVRILPEEVYLTSMTVEGNRLTLKGVANSNNTVSEFMRNLTDSPWFGEPILKVIENQDVSGVRASVFELTVDRTEPKGAATGAADNGDQS
ncbi:MAG: PilN domain-containing protein [Gammaproteobacteria bacterium]|nr:PilN domain-containing protein [Gammaproteobacteria bacterium]MCP5424660.1 PilN domain-containing protein [Gammaproteobacteria bacterium]